MKKPPSPKKPLSAALAGIAGKMAAAVLVFTLAGRWADKTWPTAFPWFTLLGATVGTAGAVYSVIAGTKNL